MVGGMIEREPKVSPCRHLPKMKIGSHTIMVHTHPIGTSKRKQIIIFLRPEFRNREIIRLDKIPTNIVEEFAMLKYIVDYSSLQLKTLIKFFSFIFKNENIHKHIFINAKNFCKNYLVY
jgi:hypothetical protein